MQEFAALEAFVPFDPGILAVVETGEVVGYHFQRFGFLAYTHNVTGLNLVGGDVDDGTVDHDVTVEHYLTCSCTSAGDTQTVYNVVQTGLEKLKQDFTGNTLQ